MHHPDFMDWRQDDSIIDANDRGADEPPVVLHEHLNEPYDILNDVRNAEHGLCIAWKNLRGSE